MCDKDVNERSIVIYDDSFLENQSQTLLFESEEEEMEVDSEEAEMELDTEGGMQDVELPDENLGAYESK